MTQTDTKPPSPLPPADQSWSHSTCSQTSLYQALNDPNITAIESDVSMGYHHTKNDNNKKKEIIETIMAHPPNRTSDLTIHSFLTMASFSDKENNRILKKHIKLDMKEMDVLKGTFDAIDQLHLLGNDDGTIFLNADILKGPGMRREELVIDAELFLKVCLERIRANRLKTGEKNVNFSFSLGWRVDCRSIFGYTKDDISDMYKLIKKHDLHNDSYGIVLAVNARVLAKDCTPFDFILQSMPFSQLLVWTAHGEPPISERKICMIRKHFQSQGTIDSVGFDCNIASSFLAGLWYDTLIVIVSLFWNVMKILRGVKPPTKYAGKTELHSS